MLAIAGQMAGPNGHFIEKTAWIPWVQHRLNRVDTLGAT